MRVLITGISGFAGRHLAALLLERGDEVDGTVHRPESRDRLRCLINAPRSLRESRVHVLDVRDPTAVAALIASVQPDAIFHLAGMAVVGNSHHDPAAVFLTNAMGTLNVMAGVRQHRPKCRVLAVGSGDAYGRLDPSDLPVRETCPFRPVSPYGASKAAADLLAYQWANGYGLDVVRVRPFNHTGPGQQPGFVCPDLAQQLVAIEQGRQPATLAVGNLDVVRDFTDVRDVVAGYVAAWECGRSGDVFNVCSGVGRSVREVAAELIEISGHQVRLSVVPERVRVTDIPVVIGCPEHLQRSTGWAPRYQWRQTLTDLLEECRNQCGVGPD
jgi:GDP-4-dehydro-6-deoxy-D-mannose reductase